MATFNMVRNVFCKHLRKRVIFTYDKAVSHNLGIYSNIGKRHLFTEEFLGIDHYRRYKVLTEDKIGSLRDEFMSKMKKLVVKGGGIPHQKDTMAMLNLVESDEEIQLLLALSKKIKDSVNINSDYNRSYSHAVMLMRMLHTKKRDDIALNIFNDKDLGKFFYDKRSNLACVVLMDLLYDKGRYDDVLDVMNIMNARTRTQGIMNFDRSSHLTLAFAACYKLNTPESYNRMISMVDYVHQHDIQLGPRSTSFTVMLALKQKHLEEALALILKSHGDSRFWRYRRYDAVTNMMVMVYTQMGSLDYALKILRSALWKDTLLWNDVPENYIKPKIFPHTMDLLRINIAEKNDTTLTDSFTALERDLTNGRLIVTEDIEEFICKPINKPRQPFNESANETVNESVLSHLLNNK